MQDTIPHWLSKQADISPNCAAIQYANGYQITFQELKEQSQMCAKKLATWGVKEGSHVAVLSTNKQAMITAIHAISYLKAVVVLLNTRLTNEELTYQIKDADASFLIYADELKVKAVQIPCLNKAVFEEIDNYHEHADIVLTTEIQLNTPFSIMYTSGTTGSPKGVIHTYGNHWWSAIGSALNLGIHSDDKWLAALPIFHVSGLSILIRSVVYGMSVYLLEKFDKTSVQKAIMHEGVTIVSVVTVMLQQLLEELGTDRYPTSLRCVLLGGGPAPRPLLEQAKEMNVPVFQSFGMTETASQIVTLSAGDALQKVGSAGKPLFPAQLMIKDPDHSGVGEICVKGPMVTSGYYKKREATNKAIQGGWLATGDLGYLDDEGFLYVVERRHDLIISGGENIYPSEIESALAGHPAIKEVGVTGISDTKWGEVPIAFIVTKYRLTLQEIMSYLDEHVASYKQPKEVYEVDALPRNASNKLVRSHLKQIRGKEGCKQLR
nr:o-succinylbenzoate--CoA ligase [Priestia megaterium]